MNVKNDSFKSELETTLEMMSDKQIKQYYTLLIIILIPYLPDYLLESYDDEGVNYLSLFVYSLFIAIFINFGEKNTRTFARDLDRDLGLAFDLDFALDRALDLDLDRDRARALALALARALDLALDLARDLALALDLALDLARDRTLILDLAKWVLSKDDTDLSFRYFLKKGFSKQDKFKYATLHNYLNQLPARSERFLHYLHKGEANPRITVWADLYEKMIRSNLKLEENVIDALLALKVKDIDATIAESSEVLYSYLYGGFSDKYEMRLIILGEKGHGKTAFRSRFMDLNGHFPEKEDTTEGVDFETYTIPDSEKEVSIKFWDFAGDTVTHEAHKYFLSERAVYVIVYGTRQENGEITKWLEHIKDFADIGKGKKPKIFILVNLLRSEATGKDIKVTINEDQLKQNYKNDFELEFDYLNLKYDNEVDGKIYAYRQKIEEYILSLDNKVPEDYVKIYDKMEAETENCFIEVAKMKKIITDTIGSYSDEILIALHKFAFFFYYPNESETNNNNRVILKPEWITHAVYKIIRYADEKNGVITRYQIQEALRQEDKNNPERDKEFVYQRESILWIERTLVHFQIAYKSQDRFVFPMCLKMQYDGNKTTLTFDEANSFQAYFTIPMKGTDIRQQLPKDIVSSIIISNHESLVEENGITLATRTHARFKNEKAQVEILRVDDFNLYMIGQGNAFEDYAEIVIDYAQKMQNHLMNNYSRFKQEMPKITVAYSKDTLEGVSITNVRQSIIDKIQNGFLINKEISVLQMLEKIYQKIDLLDHIDRNTSETNRFLHSDVLKQINEMKRHFDILGKAVQDCKGQISKEIQDTAEDMIVWFDRFLSTIEKSDLEKSKSALVRLGEITQKVLADRIILATFTSAIGLLSPNLPEMIQDILRCFGLL